MAPDRLRSPRLEGGNEPTPLFPGKFLFFFFSSVLERWYAASVVVEKEEERGKVEATG